MKIRCPSCKAAYDMDETRVPAGGVNIKCPKCKFGFRVTKTGVDASTSSTAIPLPAPAHAPQQAAPMVPPPPRMQAPPAPRSAPPTAAPIVPPAPPIASAPPAPAMPQPAAGFDSGVSAEPPGWHDAAPAPPPQPSAPAPAPIDMLDFVDDLPKEEESEPEAPVDDVPHWYIRRASGKIFGPFEFAPIVSMIGQNQVQGSEEVSTDGVSWTPLANDPRFDSYFRQTPLVEPPGLAAPGGGRVPPPMIMSAASAIPTLVSEDDAASLEELVDPKGKKKKKKKKKEKAPKVKKQKVPKEPGEELSPGARKALVVAGVTVVALGGVGVALGYATPYGFFGSKLLFPPKSKPAQVVKAPPKVPTQQSLEGFDEAAAEGTFQGWQKAAGISLKALAGDETSEEARAALALASSRLWLRYGEARADFKRAEGFAKDASDKTDAGRLLLAAVAFGKKQPVDNVKSILGTEPSVKAQLLVAAAHLEANEFQAASDVLQAMPEDAFTADYAILAARAALGLKDEEAAEKALSTLLESEPEHALAALMLAELRIDQARFDEAEEILSKVLVESASTVLDASEEARGHAHVGELRSRALDWEEAAHAFQRAADVEPTNTRHVASIAFLQLRQHRWEDAVTAFTNALEKSPNEPLLMAGQATALTATAQYVKANEVLEAARKIAPQDVDVMVAAGELQASLGKHADAHAKFMEALSIAPDHVPALVADGRNALKQRKFETARTRLERAVELSPNSAEAQGSLGLHRLATDDIAGAKAAFSKAIERNPGLAFAHLGLGDALLALGEDADAFVSFERAVKLEPDSTRARLRFARILRRQGELEQALAELKVALENDPKEAEVHANLGALLFELDRQEEAEASLRTALKLNDTSAVAHDYMGRLYAAKGEPSRGLGHLRRAVVLDPDNDESLYQLGLVHERLRQLPDAVKSFRAAIEANDRHIEAREHLASALASQSAYAEASEVLKVVLARRPDRARSLALLAECESRLDQNNEALDHFRRALEIDPTLGEVHYKLGRVFEKLGRLDEAIKSYSAATTAEPTNPWPHYYLGFAYKTRDKRKEAIHAFSRYLELNADAKDVREIRDEIYYLKNR